MSQEYKYVARISADTSELEKVLPHDVAINLYNYLKENKQTKYQLFSTIIIGEKYMFLKNLIIFVLKTILIQRFLQKNML